VDTLFTNRRKIMAGQPAAGNPTNFTFDVTSLKFVEPNEPPSNIVQRDTPFDAVVRFEFAGPTALFMVSLGLNMQVFIELEGLGTGIELDLGPEIVTTVAGQLSYEKAITVPANTLEIGTYRAQASVLGPSGSLIAGYSDKVEILQVI
jgi:hypothetical protein